MNPIERATLKSLMQCIMDTLAIIRPRNHYQGQVISDMEKAYEDFRLAWFADEIEANQHAGNVTKVQ